MNKHYSLLLLALMAPAMVLPMGLEDGPELLDPQAEAKRIALKQQEKTKKSAICLLTAGYIQAAEASEELPGTEIITLTGKKRFIPKPIVDDKLHDDLYEIIEKNDIKKLGSKLKSGVNPNCHSTTEDPIFVCLVHQLTDERNMQAIRKKLVMIDLFIRHGAAVDCTIKSSIMEEPPYSLLVDVIARPTPHRCQLTSMLLRNATRKTDPYFSPNDEARVKLLLRCYQKMLDDIYFKPMACLLISYDISLPEAWLDSKYNYNGRLSERQAHSEVCQSIRKTLHDIRALGKGTCIKSEEDIRSEMTEEERTPDERSWAVVYALDSNLRDMVVQYLICEEYTDKNFKILTENVGPTILAQQKEKLEKLRASKH